VILGGIAELIAGAISMGIGGFLASQAERDHYRYLRRTTQARVKRSCDGEVEREVHAVLGPVGLDQSVSRRVAHSLLEVESGLDQGNGGQVVSDSATDAEHGLRWSHSVGVTEFLLKFGEGLGTRPLPGPLQVFLFKKKNSLQRKFQRAAFTCLHLRLGWAILSGARSHYFPTFLSRPRTSRSFTRPSLPVLFYLSLVLSRRGLLVQRAREPVDMYGAL
jgi:hypothetical protein